MNIREMNFKDINECADILCSVYNNELWMCRWDKETAVEYTSGQFSFHLVRIAPGKAIGNHIHEIQLETHEVISGSGVCVNAGKEIEYEAGVISIIPAKIPHEVKAGDEGLYLFAKFMTAL